MTQVEDTGRGMRLDPESFSQGYFKHAVYNHWDPYEDVPQADLEADRRKLIEDEPTEAESDEFRQALARFGAGEEAVTEDLAPLMLALDDIGDQMFVSSQIYEEGKHTAFFDRYWREVVNPVAEELGHEVKMPTDQSFFTDGYVALFEKNERAMARLLEEDTPENRVRAYCHYHLVVESVLAQTGYWGLQSTFSPAGSEDVAMREFPHLEGLCQGITYIRQDEGRHVGFGMRKIQEHIEEDGVDPGVVDDVLGELMRHVANTVNDFTEATNPVALVEYSQEKYAKRLDILTDAEEELPPVEELVEIDGAENVGTAGD